MKISHLIESLELFRQENGDVEVVADQKTFSDSCLTGEGLAYEDIELALVKMPIMDMDTNKLSKESFNHVVIVPIGYLD